MNRVHTYCQNQHDGCPERHAHRPKAGVRNKMLIVVLALLALNCEAQTLKVYTTDQHGMLVYDKVYDRKNLEWAEARHVIDSISTASPGWRLPTRKEMETVFTSTYDKRRLASSLTTSDCITADYNIDGISKDTVHYVGTMRGRKFQSGLPLQEKPCRFFLVKDF